MNKIVCLVLLVFFCSVQPVRALTVDAQQEFPLYISFAFHEGQESKMQLGSLPEAVPAQRTVLVRPVLNEESDFVIELINNEGEKAHYFTSVKFCPAGADVCEPRTRYEEGMNDIYFGPIFIAMNGSIDEIGFYAGERKLKSLKRASPGLLTVNDFRAEMAPETGLMTISWELTDVPQGTRQSLWYKKDDQTWTSLGLSNSAPIAMNVYTVDPKGIFFQGQELDAMVKLVDGFHLWEAVFPKAFVLPAPSTEISNDLPPEE